MKRWWSGVSCSMMLAMSFATAASARQDAAPVGAQAPAASQPSPADEAFAPIRRDFKNLFDSLRNQGGMTKNDEPLVRALRDRAAAFSRQFPDDKRGLAIELQISMWLKDEDLVRDLYARLASMSPDDPQIPLSYAEYLISHNRFADAINAINNAKFDPAKTPNAYIQLSDALFAEERFGEALAALNAIPQSVLDSDQFVKFEVEENKRQRAEVPTLWDQEKSARDREAAANDLPRAVIKTARGDITVELFENEALNTVANFIDLAESGFYNGTRFHRVLPNFMAQGGDPNSKVGATGVPGEGNPGYFIVDEIANPDHRNHFTGTLAMAKTKEPHTGGCQFYITVRPTPHLNGIHTVFGRVLEGLDVARSLQQNDVIESITITRKRDHEYKPAKLPLPGATTVPDEIPPHTQPGAASQPATTAPETQPQSS